MFTYSGLGGKSVEACIEEEGGGGGIVSDWTQTFQILDYLNDISYKIIEWTSFIPEIKRRPMLL